MRRHAAATSMSGSAQHGAFQHGPVPHVMANRQAQLASALDDLARAATTPTKGTRRARKGTQRARRRRSGSGVATGRRSTWEDGGAGDGNRTRVTSLEGSSSAIELHPRVG
jgi:hypothetical protein